MNYKAKSKSRQFISVGGKKIGSITQGHFEKRVRASRHLYRKVPGWSFSVDVLETLDDLGVQVIWVIDEENNKTYKATLTDFVKYGVFVNEGHDAQLCLPLNKWSL